MSELAVSARSSIAGKYRIGYPGADQLRTRWAELTDWLLAHKQDLS